VGVELGEVRAAVAGKGAAADLGRLHDLRGDRLRHGVEFFS
jgi:hypothetical protein